MKLVVWDRGVHGALIKVTSHPHMTINAWKQAELARTLPAPEVPRSSPSYEVHENIGKYFERWVDVYDIEDGLEVELAGE